MSRSPAVPPDIDLYDPAPYGRSGVDYDALARQRARAPVAWHPERTLPAVPEGSGYWAVTSHAAVRHVSRTPADFSAALGGTQLRTPEGEDLEFVREMMLNMDPPQHTAIRAILTKVFTPRNVAALEGMVRRHVVDVVDAAVSRGTFDLAADVGGELPMRTLASLLGVPEEDRHLLHDWTDRVIGYADAELRAPQVDPDTGEPLNPRSRKALADMFAYAGLLAEEKLARPTDDLLSLMLAAEVDGERITTSQFENLFFLFVIAGNDTTHAALPGGLLALLQHPEQMAWVLQDLPGRLPDAIEEMLRFVPPVIHFRRTATRDLELDGVRISAGDKVAIYYPAANRDPAVFADPDRFDVTRTPGEHLSFGAGPHFCLGHAFARMQLRLAITELLQRAPKLRLAGEPEWLASNFINGLKRLPVAV